MREVEGKAYIRSATPSYGASGLAAVWAEENTREAIYEAFRRKETFATSGPRMKLRFFAGYGFDDELLDAPDVVARAYAEGVTMGGHLPASTEAAPSFLLWALADAGGAPLQRLQIVKGWVDSEGETFELVYDVACSGGAAVDPATHRCPDNGARVDLADCSISRAAGAAQLRTLWQDPDFDPGERAFYYARRAREPDLPMVDLGCPACGNIASPRFARDDPGAGLVVTNPLPAGWRDASTNLNATRRCWSIGIGRSWGVAKESKRSSRGEHQLCVLNIHPRMDIEDRVEKPRNIKPDEY